MESYIDRDIEEGDRIGIYSRTPLSSIIFLNIKEREGEGDGEDREREREREQFQVISGMLQRDKDQPYEK